MPSSSSSSGSAAKAVEIGFKVLSVLVIPLLLWGVRLEVSTSIMDERISEMQKDLDKLSDVTNAVQANSLALVRLEGKLDNLDGKVDEVKKLLRDRDR
jgi:hypothetical protein